MNRMVSLSKTISLAALLLAALLAPTPSEALILTVDGTDFIEMYGSGYYLSILPKQGITSFAHPDLASIRDGDPLYVAAHGEEGEVHGMTAQELVDFFKAHGLPKTVKTFFLLSCEAGLGSPSLVQQTGELLRQEGWDLATVVGARGCGITNRAYAPDRNSQQVVKPDKFAEMAQLQATLMQKYRPQQALDQAIQAWKLAHGGADPSLAERAKLAFGDADIRTFFDDLLTQGAQDGYLCGRGQCFQVSSYSLAGVALVPEAERDDLCVDFGAAPHDPPEVCYDIRWFSGITPVDYLQQATALIPPLVYRCASQDGRPCPRTYGGCQVYSIDGVENRGDSLWVWEIDGQPGALSPCIYNVPSDRNRITWRYLKVVD